MRPFDGAQDERGELLIFNTIIRQPLFQRTLESRML